MRLVKIRPCSYEKFSKIRDVIYETVPFAIINQGYSSELSMAIFNFWDTDYIPEPLKKYIVQPPLSRENKDLLKQKINEVLL